MGVQSVRRYPPSPAILASARSFAADRLDVLDLGAVQDEVELLLTELITNVVIHARTDFEVHLEPSGDGVRVEVVDDSPRLPLAGTLTPGALTGRGLTLVESIAARWGAHRNDAGGKTVWFEVVPGMAESSPVGDLDSLLAMWDDVADDPSSSGGPDLVEVVVPDLPVQQLVAAKAHMEDLLREVQLVLLGSVQRTVARSQRPALTEIAHRLDAAAEEFADGRRQVRRHALEAAARGQELVTLRLHLPTDAAGAAVRYSEAVRQAEELGAAGGLLVTAELLPQFAEIRHRYLDAVIEQLATRPRQTRS